MNAPFKPRLLVVEDDEGLQRQLRWAYEDYEVLVASDRDTALNILRAEEPAVVTLDLGLPPDPDGVTEGFAALETILSLKPETKVIVASGHGARESALKAIASGAYDFYQKPVDIDQLGLIVRRAFQLHGIETENRRLEEKAGDERTVLGTMVTAAPEMLKVARTIERVANTNVSVMLLGASGTGKELLARGVHSASRRAGGAFVAINCAAIPENLLEAEIVVKIPTLAERPGDGALLARHFLHLFAREMNPQVKGLAPSALAAIDAWPWPGNVRELENRMKR